MDSFSLVVYTLGPPVMGVVKSIMVEVGGGRADAAFCKLMSAVTERLRIGGKPVNHDLQKSVRKAYLQATLVVCKACLQKLGVAPGPWLRNLQLLAPRSEEVRWLDKVHRWLQSELASLPRAKYVPPTEADEQIKLLLKPKGATAEQRIHELCEKLKDSVLDEIRRRHGEPPETACFAEMVKHGWDDKAPNGAAVPLDWFDLLSAFFVYELKQNQKVANIFQSELLVNLSVEGQALTLDAVKAQFEQFGKEMVTRLNRLDERLNQLCSEQAEGFTAVQERLGEMLPTLALLPDIATQQQTLNELLQAALRELRRRSIYQHYSGREVALKTEKLLDDYTALFVGREGKLAELDELLTAQRGIAAVAAPAGYGKTALLANWARLRHGDSCFIACHFFTERVTRSVTEAYRNLLRQLYAYYELTDEELPRDKQDLRDTIIGLLNERGARADEPLVIILDGLDEADEAVDLFFYSVPDAVFIVVSARWAGNPPSFEEGNPHGEPPERLRRWLELKDSRLIRLDLMNESEIAEWLRQWGDGELRSFADDPSFVRDLHETTDGLPLYLRYLLDDLGQAARQGRDVRAVLEQTPKGFEAYVREQLKQLASHVRNEPAVRKLFSLLTAAKGTLRESEVEALTELRAWDLLGLPDAVTRWWNIGEESGERTYAFAHRLLAEEFAKALGREAGEAKAKIVDWCAQWSEHQSPYALRHYAEHLREAKRYEELFELARDEAFRQAQEKAFSHDPDLPLATIQTALRGAAETDDAGAMAEFLLAHARRLIDITQESPLDTLRRTSNIERAWALADLFEIERCVLWHLLLAWELKDIGRLEDARATLDRLLKKKQPLLSFLWSRHAIDLFVQTFDISEKAFTTLHQQLLDDEGNLTLCAHLAAHGHFAAAFQTAQQLADKNKQGALIEIAEAQAQAGELEVAIQTAESMDADGQIWMLEKIAVAQAQAGQVEAARATFASVLQIAQQIKDEEEREIRLSWIAEAQAQAGEFAAAVQTARRIKKQWYREQTLSKIAIAQAQSGQTEAARSTFALCEFKEKTLVGRYEFTHEILAEERVEVLREIAAAQARAGETEAAQATFSAAVQAALQIKALAYETGEQVEALCEIAMTQAQVGQGKAAHATFAIAIQTVQRDEDFYHQAETLRKIAIAQAKAGQFNASFQTVQQIRDSYNRHEALIGIAIVQAQAGQFDDAIRTAQQIEYEFFKAEALREIAKVQARAGDEQGAEVTFATAVQTAQGIETETDQIEALALIAAAQAQRGHIAEARATFSAAETVHRTGKYKSVSDMRYLDTALMEIAQAQVVVGDIAGMPQTVQRIEDITQRVETLRKIVEAQAQADETRAAGVTREAIRTAYAGTLQVAPQYDDDFYVRYVFLLRGIAEAQTQTGDTVGAKTTLETAHGVAQHIKHEYLRVYMLSEIAVAQAQGGDREAARATFDLALEITKRIDDYNQKRSLLKVGVAQAQVEEREMARTTFDFVLQIVQEINDHQERARNLAAILAAQAESEETELAQATFSAIVQTVQQIPHQYKRDEVLVDVAKALASKKAFVFALQTAQLIEGEREKAEALKEVAVRQAEVGEFDAANSLADAGDKEHFKRQLLPCAYYLDAAYRMCGLLARLYPEQAGKVAEVVTG